MNCRHEPPVMANGISILQEEPDVVTVCKPASVPVSQGHYEQSLISTHLSCFLCESDLIEVHLLHD